MKPNIKRTGILIGFLFSAITTEARAESPSVANVGNENLKFGLSSRFRWEDSDLHNLGGHKQFSSIRLRPSMTFTGIEGLKVFVEPQYNKILGAQSGSIETSGNANYTGSIDTINLRNAYLDLALHENVSFIVGRQSFSYGDQYILGPSDRGVYGRTFDALLLQYKSEIAVVDVFQAKIVETAPAVAGSGSDKDLFGVHASLSPSEALQKIEAYGFYLQDKQSDAAGSGDDTRPWNFGVYGTRLVTSFGSWSWTLEAAKNFGSENTPVMDSDSKNHMIDTRLDTRLGETGSHLLGAHLFIAGENWRDFYPTNHRAQGRTDVLGRRNISGAAVHWNVSWSEKWSTELDIFAFTRTSTERPVYLPGSKATLGTTNSSSKDVGSEIDFSLKRLINQKLPVSSGISFFKQGNYLRESIGGPERSPHYGYIMIEAKY